MSTTWDRSECRTTWTHQERLIMPHGNAATATAQFPSLFRFRVIDPRLPFAHVHSAEMIGRAFLEEIGRSCEGSFTSLVTLAAWCKRVLSSHHLARSRQWEITRGPPQGRGPLCYAPAFPSGRRSDHPFTLKALPLLSACAARDTNPLVIGAWKM